MTARLLPKGRTDLLRQILLVCGAYLLYRLVRGQVDGRAADAFENARHIIGAEQSIGPVRRARRAPLGGGTGLGRRRRELDVRQLALHGHDRRARLPLPAPQRPLLLRAQHVHDRDGDRPRGLRGVPHRAAAPAARVGLPGLGRAVHRSRRAALRRVLQPVRRRAVDARRVRADARAVDGGDRAPSRGARAVALLPGGRDVRRDRHGQPLVVRRRTWGRPPPRSPPLAAQALLARARPDAWAWNPSARPARA